MATPRYELLMLDSSTGHAVATLPVTPGLTFPKRLNDIGTFTFQLPLSHPAATDLNLATRGFSQNSDRELLVLRNDVPVRDYAVTGATGTRRGGSVQVTCAESSWWMRKRCLETDKTYDGAILSHDVYDILRDVGTYMTSKESNGLTSGGTSINAALPRFTVAPTSGLAGVTKDLTYRGTDRKLWSDIVGDIVSDPDFGCDFRLDVSGTRAAPQRTLQFGVPSLGGNVPTELNDHNLYDFGKTLDRERAGNRAHTVAAFYTDTEQNTGSISNGDLLMDVVAFRSDLTVTAAVTQYTKDLRRRSQPWISTYTAWYVPNDSGGLPFGLCNVGDAVYINYQPVTPEFLHTGPGYARVVGIDVTPPSAGQPELVALTFDIPLDELGA